MSLCAAVGSADRRKPQAAPVPCLHEQQVQSGVPMAANAITTLPAHSHSQAMPRELGLQQGGHGGRLLQALGQWPAGGRRHAVAVEEHGCGRGLQGLACSGRGGGGRSRHLCCQAVKMHREHKQSRPNSGTWAWAATAGAAAAPRAAPRCLIAAGARIRDPQGNAALPGGLSQGLQGLGSTQLMSWGGLPCHRARLRRPPVGDTGCSGSKGEQLQRSRSARLVSRSPPHPASSCAPGTPAARRTARCLQPPLVWL